MSKIAITVGQRIRNYRNNLSLSQEELAERSGLHPTYIGQLERGEKNATLESIEKVAIGLSIPLSKLFENIGEFSDCSSDYPMQAYELVHSAAETQQAKLVEMLKMIINFK